MAVEHLTIESFKEKIFNFEKNKEWTFEGTIPAIIDFYADWCGPCKMVSPVLEDLQKEFGERINIYKINTEQEKELSQIFGIQSIPSILFVPVDGKPQMAQGAIPKEGFIQAMEEVLDIK